MTSDAAAYLARVCGLDTSSVLATERRTFDEGCTSEVHLELQRLGLISMMLGTNKGFGWLLTPEGASKARKLGATG